MSLSKVPPRKPPLSEDAAILLEDVQGVLAEALGIVDRSLQALERVIAREAPGFYGNAWRPDLERLRKERDALAESVRMFALEGEGSR